MNTLNNNLNGSGHLIINGNDRGEISYRIDLHETSAGGIQGIGEIEATQSAVFEAVNSNDVQIQRNDGSSFAIEILTPRPSGIAAIETRGPL